MHIPRASTLPLTHPPTSSPPHSLIPQLTRLPLHPREQNAKASAEEEDEVDEAEVLYDVPEAVDKLMEQILNQVGTSIYPLTYAHSLIHPLARITTHSLTHSYTLTQPLTQTHNHSLKHTLTHHSLP